MHLAVSNTFWAIIKRTFKNTFLLTNAVYHRTSLNDKIQRDRFATVSGAKKGGKELLFKIPKVNILCTSCLLFCSATFPKMLKGYVPKGHILLGYIQLKSKDEIIFKPLIAFETQVSITKNTPRNQMKANFSDHSQEHKLNLERSLFLQNQQIMTFGNLHQN